MFVVTLILAGFLSLAASTAHADSCYFFLSCAPDKIFHPVKCDSTGCKSGDGIEAVPPVTMFVENHGWDVYTANKYPKILLPTTFYRGWLEFNDAGHAFGPDQKTAILRKIEELGKAGQPIFLVIYIHGWHNNADNSNPDTDLARNAVKFDYFMARQADQVRRLFEQRDISLVPSVLGIYVGWRGDSLTSPLWRMTTIGNRAAAANRLAANRDESGDLYPSLVEISKALHQADSHARMVVFGHSLGGRIVTRLFMDDVAKGNVQPLGENSLLVALEPAIGADCYEGVLGPQHSGQGSMPTFISVTSQNDDSVGWIYEKASFFIPDCNVSSPAHGRTVGNYNAYLTHGITYPDYHDGNITPLEAPGAFPQINAPNNWYVSPGRKTIAYKMRLVHCETRNIADCYDPDSQTYTMDYSALDNVSRAGPVWNVLTDLSVIDLTNDPNSINSRHNGYISTNLTRAVIEMLYARTP